MKMNAKRLLTALLLATLLTGTAACGGSVSTGSDTSSQATAGNDSSAETATETPTETAAAAPTETPRDLGGVSIILGDWWTDNNAAEQPAQNLHEEQLRAYRAQIQKDYNFTIKQTGLSGWGEYEELFMTSVMAGDPAADIFIMAPGFVAQPLAKGLLYPLSDLKSLNFDDAKWNQTIRENLTLGGKTFGMTPTQRMEPRDFLFFNKRLLSEAGIDPEEPYDLQASGQWTWDKFKEYCQKLTRDTNGDGVPDTYALQGFSVEIFAGLMYSNNARYVGKDANGLFYNAVTEPQALEALQFGRSLWADGFVKPYPEGANWDWFVTAFHDAHVAMIIREEYSVGSWADMADDWGMVFVPKGPQAKNNDYLSYFSENVVVMPKGLSKERAEAAAYAYNLWTQPLPGDLEDSEAWKTDYYARFRDSRAVDETLSMLYDGRGELDLLPYIYGIDLGGDLIWNMPEGEATPAELIEACKPKWDAAIADANAATK